MKNFLFVSLKIFCGMLIAALLLELALRILPTCHLPMTTAVNTKHVAKPILPNQGVVYSRGWMFQIGNFVEINADGFHSGTDYIKRTDGNSVAFVGDSIVENTLVDSGHLLHPVLERKFGKVGANVSVASFGNSASGLGDIVNFMRLGCEKYNIKYFIIKFDYKDILDDLSKNDGHFVYVFDGDKAEIKLIPKYRGFEKFKSVALIRYLFSNLQLSPGAFISKLKAEFGIASSGKPKTVDKQQLSKEEDAILEQFILDILKIVDGDARRILFMSREKFNSDVIKEKFHKYGFECVDIDAATHSDSEADLSHFHNDDHWNVRGIERVCSAVEKTEFFKRIANGAKSEK